jgi:hypothetical protein
MNEQARPPESAGRDYDAVEAAVMETECGRWFLSEFRRRNRGADTQTVLLAVRSLEKRIKALQAVGPINGTGSLRSASPSTAAKLIAGAKATASRPADNRVSSPAVTGKVILGKVFAGAGNAPAKLSAENLKYFERDEELFAAVRTAPPTRSKVRRPDAATPLPSFLVRTPSLSSHPAALSATRENLQVADIVKRRIVVRTAQAAPTIPLADELGLPARQAG